MSASSVLYRAVQMAESIQRYLDRRRIDLEALFRKLRLGRCAYRSTGWQDVCCDRSGNHYPVDIWFSEQARASIQLHPNILQRIEPRTLLLLERGSTTSVLADLIAEESHSSRGRATLKLR